jgi:hypothetical protein
MTAARCFLLEIFLEKNNFKHYSFQLQPVRRLPCAEVTDPLAPCAENVQARLPLIGEIMPVSN